MPDDFADLEPEIARRLGLKGTMYPSNEHTPPSSSAAAGDVFDPECEVVITRREYLKITDYATEQERLARRAIAVACIAVAALAGAFGIICRAVVVDVAQRDAWVAERAEIRVAGIKACGAKLAVADARFAAASHLAAEACKGDPECGPERAWRFVKPSALAQLSAIDSGDNVQAFPAGWCSTDPETEVTMCSEGGAHQQPRKVRSR